MDSNIFTMLLGEVKCFFDSNYIIYFFNVIIKTLQSSFILVYADISPIVNIVMLQHAFFSLPEK